MSEKLNVIVANVGGNEMVCTDKGDGTGTTVCLLSEVPVMAEELKQLRKENEALKVAYGDNWYDGFMVARDRVLSGECIEEYSTEAILSLSEVAEEEKVNKAKELNSK